jgi:molecular chaperone GrpE
VTANEPNEQDVSEPDETGPTGSDDSLVDVEAETFETTPPEPTPIQRPEEVALRKKVAELESRIETLQDQTRHYAQAYDKARTEFAAARERMQRENDRSLKRDQVKAVSGLLNVLDSLDRSLESVKAQPPGLPFVEGVQMIRQQFEAALNGLGLQRFDGVGERFDPQRHQALTMMPVTDAAQDGRVIHGVSAGAIVGDEVVRAATVVVGKLVEQDDVH